MKKTILFEEFEERIISESDVLLDDDELSPVEAAFIRGYEEAV